MRRPRCAHRRWDRGACTDCGLVRGDGRPAARAPALSLREQRAADERRHIDDLADHRAVIASLMLVCALTRLAVLREMGGDIAGLRAALEAAEHCAALEAENARIAGLALEKVMDALVAFDARCARGDVTGAARALRAGLARLRGPSPPLKLAAGGG